MVKTWEEYYNDPRIIDEPSALREIHAIRLQIQDERQGLSVKEYNDIVDQQAAAFTAEGRAARAAKKECNSSIVEKNEKKPLCGGAD